MKQRLHFKDSKLDLRIYKLIQNLYTASQSDWTGETTVNH